MFFLKTPFIALFFLLAPHFLFSVVTDRCPQRDPEERGYVSQRARTADNPPPHRRSAERRRFDTDNVRQRAPADPYSNPEWVNRTLKMTVNAFFAGCMAGIAFHYILTTKFFQCECTPLQ